MSRLTKHIRLVLISSSLVLPGCDHGWDDEAACEPATGETNSNLPPACGPVDGRYRGGGGHYAGYHGYGGHYGGSTWGRGGSSSHFGGHSSIGGSSRGGFGSFGHGVGS